MTVKEFYNPELETTAVYEEVWRKEVVAVRDVSDLSVLNHYWRAANGELWGDFDDPMENVHRGFAAYRQHQNYMTPAEVKALRINLKLTVRQFAEILGISTSSLTQIENNHRVQARYQENLFEMAQAYYLTTGDLPAKWTEHGMS